MSKISLKPNASGTGVFSLEAPNSNSDRTLNLPDEAGTVLTNVSDISAANLTGDVAAERITGALNATGSAPVYACRAWVNFDGTGTVSIRDSGNVSSITDNGTGIYTVNFVTAMPDNDYAVTGTTQAGAFVVTSSLDGNYGVSTVRVFTDTGGASFADKTYIMVAIFR